MIALLLAAACVPGANDLAALPAADAFIRAMSTLDVEATQGLLAPDAELTLHDAWGGQGMAAREFLERLSQEADAPTFDVLHRFEAAELAVLHLAETSRRGEHTVGVFRIEQGCITSLHLHQGQ